MAHYGISKTVNLTYDQALEKVQDALKEQGFGVLTEIDVAATLKAKLDVDFGRRYIILGACNPNLAYQALQAERELGLLLPCNVIVYEGDDGTVVSAVDPNEAMAIVNNSALQSVAKEARERLRRAIDSV